MAHDTNALDCFFGPYDFLDAQHVSTILPQDLLAQRQAAVAARLAVVRAAAPLEYAQRAPAPPVSLPQYCPPPPPPPLPPSLPSVVAVAAVEAVTPPVAADEKRKRALPVKETTPPSVAIPVPSVTAEAEGEDSEDSEGPAKRGRSGASPEASSPDGANQQDKVDRCRARNREHARQTRRRKKEFVENLQTSVQTLSCDNATMTQRLAGLEERARDRRARAEVVQRLVALRASNEDDDDLDLDAALGPRL